jgi:queuosine biosynthesis protein QueC
MQNTTQSSALVVFSGGQDSTTILAWAKNRFDYVEAISFNYGQKHSIELEQGAKICQKLNIKRTLVDISFLSQLCDSALTTVDGDVNVKHTRLKDLPASFVPNRNALLLTLANNYAQKAGLNHLVTGTCETDYSGYPDCRRLFIDSLENALFTASNKSELNLADIQHILVHAAEVTETRHNMPVVRISLVHPEIVDKYRGIDIKDSLNTFFGDSIFITQTNPEVIAAIGVLECSYLYNFIKDTHILKTYKAKITPAYTIADLSHFPVGKVNAHNVTSNLSNFYIKIHTPLMYLSKSDTFRLAEEEGALDLVLEDSHTCYEGDRTHRHAWGYGCGKCPACVLRQRGYEEFINRS